MMPGLWGVRVSLLESRSVSYQPSLKGEEWLSWLPPLDSDSPLVSEWLRVWCC